MTKNDKISICNMRRSYNLPCRDCILGIDCNPLKEKGYESLTDFYIKSKNHKNKEEN